MESHLATFPIVTKNQIVSHEEHIVPQLDTAIRLQEYGTGIFQHAETKSALKKAIKKGYIKVNNVIASTATYIKGGESITLSVPIAASPIKAPKVPLKVLFEDDHLAIIHKPAGILVSGNRLKTIANVLEQNIKPGTAVDATKPHPVHRLDYETTGALLVGKTKSSIRKLNALFEKDEVKKTYYAVTIGELSNQGVIKSAIEGKASESTYELVKTAPSARFGNLNLVKLIPKTGRRHQLRIHLASLNNPILGDNKYGIENLVLQGKGLYLHAYSLNFLHPVTKEAVHITDELPEKFKAIFK